MEQYSIILFDAMQAELEQIMNGPGNFVRKLELSYETAQRFWISLQIKLVSSGFESNKEEIHFFRNIKPLFISGIEYFNLVYRLEVFKPAGDRELEAFLQNERQRLHNFTESIKEFYQYYKSGQTDRDEIYFLRSANTNKNPSVHKPYLDIAASTSHDYLVSYILALEKYDDYIRSKFPL
jgi:hypothetical protein